MKNDFDPATKEKAAGRTRVLLMDGHGSHYTLELLEYARANNIVILGYPPYCTHVLQGLDVVCFAKMKTEFRHEIRTFEDLHKAKVKKGDFTGVFGRAFLRAFTKESVEAAFRATGIHPFNPDVIPEKAVKASLPTSTKAGFPLVQPSPVRAVIVAMGAHPPTSFEVDPDTHTRAIAGPSSSSISSARREICDLDIDPRLHEPPLSISPSSRRRVHSPDIHPIADTPSKRMRILYGGLASTSSGSFLVAKTRMTSADKIPAPVFEPLPELPKPDWTLLQGPPPSTYQSREMLEQTNRELTEHLARSRDIIRAHETMEESREAQIIIQHAYLTKANESLFAKENKKKDDRTVLFEKGMGRHLTDPQFAELLQKHEREKQEAAANKQQRKAGREAGKAARAALEAEWKVMVANHEKDVAEWKVQCERLRAENMRARDLPKKPARPKKPKLPSRDPNEQAGPSGQAQESSESSSSDED
jgi:hypothetical protein